MSKIGNIDNNTKYCFLTRKKCYTEIEAGYAINSLKRKYTFSGRKNNIPKRKYFCKFCSSWHLTHYSTNKKKKKGNKNGR